MSPGHRFVDAKFSILIAGLLLAGCPPDDDPPVYDGGGIQAKDTAGPDVDASRPDMPDRPRDMGERDMGTTDAARMDMAGLDASRPDMGPSVGEAVEEPSEPRAEAIARVGDRETATTITVTATNLDTEVRLMRLGVLTYTGGRHQTDQQPPTRVEAGASVSATFDLRGIGIVTSTLKLPAIVTPRIVVEAVDGSPIERVYGEAIEVGPTLAAGFANLLTAKGLQPSDVPTDGAGSFQSKLAAADIGDAGLSSLELQGPGEDEGPPLPGPNYDDGVPDANGLFHYTICLRWPVNWVDAGFGEDYGVQPEGTWRARGSRVQITANNQLVFDDYLDAQGCTPVLDTTTKTNFVIVGYSVAQANGNTVIVRDNVGDIDSYVRVVDNLGGSGTKHFTFPQTNRSNLLAATTFTLARFGVVSGSTFEVNDRCDPANNLCCDCANSTGIWVQRRTRKFLISHEVGHRLLSEYTGGYNNDCTKLLTPDTLPCAQTDSNSHALTSHEFSACAAMEGWAHFVAVRAYNHHLEGMNPEATFQYWGSGGITVDVERGPTGGVDKFFETQCGVSGAGLVGSGVELDWMRHWWDYHTSPSPELPVDLATMMAEIDRSANWGATTAYQLISNGIESHSGAPQRARWEAIAAGNGVDH